MSKSRMSIRGVVAAAAWLVLLGSGAAGALAAETEEDAPSRALLNRLGIGEIDTTANATGATAVRGGDVLPEYDERTSTHLDLAGQSPTDMTRRRLACPSPLPNGISQGHRP